MYTATVLIMWFGGNMILQSRLQVGQLTGFLSYVMQVMNSLMLISNVFLLLTARWPAPQRILEVLDEPVTLTSPQRRCTPYRTEALNSVPSASATSGGPGIRAVRRHAPHPRGPDCGDSRRHRFRQDHAGTADPPAL